jgi:hypothetical protein
VKNPSIGGDPWRIAANNRVIAMRFSYNPSVQRGFSERGELMKEIWG